MMKNKMNKIEGRNTKVKQRKKQKREKTGKQNNKR